MINLKNKFFCYLQCTEFPKICSLQKGLILLGPLLGKSYALVWTSLLIFLSVVSGNFNLAELLPASFAFNSGIVLSTAL